MSHKLSVVIVNYNVKYFLEQALRSVEKAIEGMDAEVWVVDNNSVDGSVAMVQEKFTWAKVIANKANVGFSRANNQAIRQSNSDYVLLLNPDTVLQEDSLKKCVAFMDTRTDVGALGVRMIDGKGKFLPESKRGLPSPAVALYKMTGLSGLFPKSRVFGRYHLKYLSEHETHEVDVLSGAFMMMRSLALDHVGLLDEDYFMYGEDIDLSYRIMLGGYKNVYFADTTIIHYKGESTKRKSANYVKVFYNAMVLFAKKHYSSSMAGWFAFFIQMAIYLRAGLAFFARLAEQIWLPLLDFGLIVAGYVGIAKYWELYHKFVRGYYPSEFYGVHVPLYALVVIFMVWISGGYDRMMVARRLLRGGVVGAIVLFAMYAFFPRDWHFSRAILALGSAWALGVFFITRGLAQALKLGGVQFDHGGRRKVVLVGGTEECERIERLLKLGRVNHEILGWVSARGESSHEFLGGLYQLSEVLAIYQPDLVIFSGKDVPSTDIMTHMIDFQSLPVQVKIAPERGETIIGSDSKNQPGELFTLEVDYHLAQQHHLRNKRVLDLILCVWVMVFCWILVWGSRGRILLKHGMRVLAGRETWVGYRPENLSLKLPKIKPCVLDVSQPYAGTGFENDAALAYARDYAVSKDAWVFWRNLLGKSL
ncbi:MAG: glycosyltransferase [Sphingomonadales bacterium]|nr:glycosyltransferase [Sphingomonadales bacterium]